MRANVIAIVLLAVAATATGSAAEPSLPAGHERYIVVLERKAKDSGKSVGDEAKNAGGRVEADLGDRLVITAPPAAIEILLRHVAVKYVQKAVVGPVADTGRLTEVRAMSAIDAPVQSHSGQTWTTGDYSYDGAGNIASIGTSAVPGTQGYRTYGYDSVTRLTKAEIAGVTPGATYEYSYDAYGNRDGYAINEQWISVGVSSATNRLDEATYDSSGNQLSRGATAATYDGFGMVTSYRFDSTNAETYVYTASDERIGVLRGTDWTWSVRGGDGLVLRQYRSSSTTPTAPWLWIEDFVYRDRLLLGSERVPEEGGRRHYHLDHLGSPRVVTGLNGSVISEHDFLPFGEERTKVGQHVARGFDREEPLRFTGHERGFDNLQPNDSSAYIDYMHARYYATKAGRFLSVDPHMDLSKNLPEPQSWNRYSYVRNNPVNMTDPDGRIPVAWWALRMGGPPLARYVARETVVAVARVTRTAMSEYGAQRLSNFEYARPVVIPTQLSVQDPYVIDDSRITRLPEDRVAAPPDKRGNAPIGDDGHPIEIHHDGQQADSPLIEMTRTDHRGKGNFGSNHDNTGQSPSQIDRKSWVQAVKDYWKREWDRGRFNTPQ